MNNENAVSSNAGELNDEIDLLELLGQLESDKFWIIGIAAVFLLIGVAYAVLSTPIFRADATVQVESEKSSLGALSELTELSGSSDEIGAEIEILKSRSIIGRVVDDLNLTTEVSPQTAPIIGNFLLRRLGDNAPTLEVRRFDIDVNSPMGFLLTKTNDGFLLTLNNKELASGKVEESVEVNLPDAKNGYLNIRELKGKPGQEFHLIKKPRIQTVQSLQSSVSISEVGRKTGVIRIAYEHPNKELASRVVSEIANQYLRQNVERRTEEAEKSLAFLDRQLPDVRADLDAAEEKLSQFRQKNRTVDLTVETESLLKQLVAIEQRLSEIDLKRTELQRNYTAEHPLMQALAQQRNQLATEKQKIESATGDLPDVQQQMLKFTRDLEVSSELYQFLLNKSQELRVVKAGTIGNVRILDSAQAQPMAVKPQKALIAALSLMLGLFAGVAFSLVRRMLRRGVADPTEIEQKLGLPVYAVIPHSPHAGQIERREHHPSLVGSKEEEFSTSEAFKSLRTSLHFAISAFENPVIAITGPAPNVGKTFVSSNLANMLAVVGTKVLLVDADMRRGDGHTVFKVEKTPGLSQLLANPESEGCIRKVSGSENLYYLPRGATPPNPSELLMGANFGLLIERWRKEFDLVIIDTPPVLAVTDAVIVSKLSDALFFIARAGQTHVGEIEESRRRLGRANVEIKGVIINGLTGDMKKRGYASDYAYEYSYESVK